MEDLVTLAINHARSLGAEYAEARWQRSSGGMLLLRNGMLEAGGLVCVEGIGIRALVEGALGFASTNVLTKEAVRTAAEEAVRMARAARRLLRHPVRMAASEVYRDRVEVSEQQPVEHIGLEDRLKFCQEIDRALQEVKEVRVPMRVVQLGWGWDERLFMNSEGAEIRSRIPRIYVRAQTTAMHPQRGVVQKGIDRGGVGGWEIVSKYQPVEESRQLAQTLERVLMEGVAPPTGRMDIVLGSEVVGLACHESCGHPSEADRIMGREAAQAGESFITPDMLGTRIGSDLVTIVDDPTVEGGFGYYLYDDEGVKARRKFLYKEGVINELLHNRETAAALGVESNGSARAVAYNREPIIRMSNTFLLPGDFTVEELIEGVRKGVYVVSFMEWNIDDRRWNQRYVGLEAYRIENGELKELVRDPVLEITTKGLWSSVDAVGKDLEFWAGMCGKGDPMQACPVWIGGPSVRLRNVHIGRRSA